MSSDFDEDGEDSETHSFMKNLDDTSKYVTIRGVAKKRDLALPQPI